MLLSGFFLLLIIYTYLLYPIAIYVAAMRSSKKSVTTQRGGAPSVTLIIPGHNIEHLVPQKIECLKGILYDGDLEFLFVLDGCSDKSEDLIKSMTAERDDIKCFVVKERNGKEFAVKKAIEGIESDVLVFSDADAILDPFCVQNLVDGLLSSDDIGAVSGREIHEKISEAGASEGQGLFYRYEEFLKANLSKVSSLTYVQGGNFAMWAELYPRRIPEGCTQDGVIAFEIVQRGLRVAYQEKALTREQYSLSNHQDFERRVRTISRAFYSILCMSDYVLNPFKSGWFCIHLFSGRILRWFTLYFAFLALIFAAISSCDWYSNLVIWGAFIAVIFSVLGGVLESFGKRIKLFYFFYYFLYMHAAAAKAVMNVFLGRRVLVWRPSN